MTSQILTSYYLVALFDKLVVWIVDMNLCIKKKEKKNLFGFTILLKVIKTMNVCVYTTNYAIENIHFFAMQ